MGRGLGLNIERFKRIVSERYLLEEMDALVPYLRDAGWWEGDKPDAVVRPGSAEEISEIVRAANEDRIPITIRGAGSSYTGGALCYGGGLLMELTRLDGLIELDEESNSVTVQPGMSWAKMNCKLRGMGFHTGFRGPGSGITATIGGAASVSSIWWGAAKYGTVGDQIIGFQVVLPRGEIIRTGSGANPYARNFCRYGLGPDLSGLFIGDHGVFGVKTEVVMRAYPLPEYVDFFEYGFPSEVDAVSALEEMARRNSFASDIIFLEEEYTSYAAPRYPNWDGSKAIVAGDIEADNRAWGEAQREIFDDVVRRHGGRVLEPNYSKYIYDNMFNVFFWGRRDNGLLMGACNQVPIRGILKTIRSQREYIERNPDLFKRHFNYRGMFSFIVRGHMNTIPTLYLPWNLDAEPSAKEVAHRIWSDSVSRWIECGGIHYWIGKLIGEILYSKIPREYHRLLSALKKALDPNRILNPALWDLWGA
ncbi:MAG: FAD-binding oxidoreductase [Candidatus Bathyarchaeia archaeon]